MKTKIRVNKYQRNDGTKVRTHNRNIEVDVFRPENKEDSFENKDDYPSINIDKNLVQSKKSSEKENTKKKDKFYIVVDPNGDEFVIKGKNIGQVRKEILSSIGFGKKAQISDFEIEEIDKRRFNEYAV